MGRIIETIALPMRLALRVQAISFAITRYGLAESFAHFGIEITKQGIQWVMPSGPKPQGFDKVFAKNLKRLFVHLGPTFIKLGQMLAMRPDLVGEAIAWEMESLFDRVPPIPFRRIKKILSEEWGSSRLNEEFKIIEKKPLASASLGQVHQGVLKDGSPVIVKIQKPNVAQKVELDLLIMEGFIRSADLVYPKWQLLSVFKDFKTATLKEIDYREEVKNIERFQKNYHSFFNTSDVVFPKYYPLLSGKRVIVMEPLHGKKLSGLKQGGKAAKKAAVKSVTAVLEQIFEHGFFHADPHSGNLFFMEDTGQVGFVDLGLVGRLDPSDKQKFLKVILAVLRKDRNGLVKSLYELGETHSRTDFKKFQAEINKLIDEHGGKIRDLRLDQLINRLLSIARKNGILIPNRYLLMARSCLIIDGIARSSGVSLMDIAAPIVARGLLKSYNPFRWFRS